MDFSVTLPVGQLLNEAPQLRREVAFNLQSGVPRYRVKRAAKPAVGEESAVTMEALSAAMVEPPVVTTQALEDDGVVKSIFLTSWVEQVRVDKTLADLGSVIEIASAKLMAQLPHLKIQSDGHVVINLVNDQRTTLTELFLRQVKRV